MYPEQFQTYVEVLIFILHLWNKSEDLKNIESKQIFSKQLKKGLLS